MIETYNERLFSGGLRKWLHEMRFRWLREETKGMQGSVIELGCFDARSLDYMSFVPTRYLGIDAGWEGGLEAAMARYPQYEFRRSNSLYRPCAGFDLAIALETLEHLPRRELPTYIDMLSRTAPILLASVPVEIGPMFVSKYLVKAALRRSEKHRLSEFLFAALGMADRVEQNQHKGFDYRLLIQLLKSHYRRVAIQGLPFARVPMLCFTVAIRAET